MSLLRLPLLLPFLLGLVAMATPASAAPGDTFQVAGQARVRVAEPAKVTLIEDLRFGAIMQPPTAGTVTVAPDSTITSTIDISAFPYSRGAARFLVTGDPNRRFLFQLPNSMVVTSGTAFMVVNRFRTNAVPPGITARLNAAGEFVLDVGARLNVGAVQQPGEYSGTFDLTVVYL